MYVRPGELQNVNHVSGEIDQNSPWAVLTLRASRLRRSSPIAGAIGRTAVLIFIQDTQNTKRPHEGAFWYLARPERFELPTAWFVARYSIQLSYGRNVWSAGLRPSQGRKLY